MTERIQSFSEFFPYYLGEHRDPTCRALHFVGTTGFFAISGWFLWREPSSVGPAIAGMVILGLLGHFLEPHRNPAPLFLAMIGLGLWVQPWLLTGIVWAYAFAWVAHFKIENNRPATFTYPLWSLISDFRMWGLMVTGKLWSGDPVEEFGRQAASSD